MAEEKLPSDKKESSKDTVPKVTGIGGFSFSQIIPKKQENGILKIWDLKSINGVQALNLETPTGQTKSITCNGVRLSRGVTIFPLQKRNL